MTRYMEPIASRRDYDDRHADADRQFIAECCLALAYELEHANGSKEMRVFCKELRSMAAEYGNPKDEYVE